MSNPLRKSIEHWERLVEACKAEDKERLLQEGWGCDQCALCDEYYDYGCSGCPVMEYTTLPGCEDTPYDKAGLLFYAMTKTEWPPPAWSFSERTPETSALAWEDLVIAAQEELDFLKSLENDDVSD